MDAYDLAHKIQKYWSALYPKNSGEISKAKKAIKVCVMTEYGLREVRGLTIEDDSYILLELDKDSSISLARLSKVLGRSKQFTLFRIQPTRKAI